MPRAMVGHPNLILETLPEVCGKLDWEFKSNPKALWGNNEWDSIHCFVGAKKFNAHFELQQMPGCCAVLIGSYIYPEPELPIHFNELIGTITEAAYEAGFGSMMLSQVLRYNDPRKHIWGGLINKSWEMSKPFINAKSGNQVVYLTKNLRQIGKVRGLEIPA